MYNEDFLLVRLLVHKYREMFLIFLIVFLEGYIITILYNCGMYVVNHVAFMRISAGLYYNFARTYTVKY